uniref:CFAP97 domain containing 1 n=1 Tax=Acanthochromis polyacanthus TaxID=80966 RepID=A0A3Q1GG55_9TELE
METPGRPETVRLMMQNREYKPLFFSRNKYLQEKWKKAYDVHRRQVKSVKPTICIKPPKKFVHLTLSLKNKQHQVNAKIQKENDRLKEKISQIMATTGRVDSRNDYEKKSIRQEKRQRELISISKENQMIQFRLSQCKPHYRARNWREDWLNTLKLRDSIGHYPRGSAKQQKEQENWIADSKGNEKRKETNNKEDTGGKIGEESATQFASKPNVPEVSISADTPENCGPSDN